MIRVIYLGTCYSNEIMKARHPKAGSKGNGWVLLTFLLSKNILYILIFGTSIYRCNIIVASLGFLRSSADQKTLASEDADCLDFQIHKILHQPR